MLREYTASFTSVKPCLYQPPPGTAIVVAARPTGVKVHVPLRSTEAIAAFPAATPSAPAGATAPGAARADPWIARATPAAATAAASPPAVAGNQPRRRAFERGMPTSCDSSASSQHRFKARPQDRYSNRFDNLSASPPYPGGWLRLGYIDMN